MNILINTIGIQDSGGITVLTKLFKELQIDSSKKYIIICNNNFNINSLIQKYQNIEMFKFILLEKKGFLYRLYYENIIFNKIIKKNRIHLVYNFSGSAQFFLNIPQITKVQNLLFYSKKIDRIYFQRKAYLQWFKQVFFKRLVFHSMLRQVKHIEAQSSHVKDYVSDFIDISNKQFFIKSDIEASKNLLEDPKQYDFLKKIRFLYIVGPHFEYFHKNFEDFVKAMIEFKKGSFDFEIVVTLTKEQLENSNLWDKNLDEKTYFLGYISKEELKKQFQDNTLLISTSVIETLGLHVVEAIQNGILAIVPNEKYSLDVYGANIFTYELFHIKTLVDTIKNIRLLDANQIEDIIQKNQDYLIKNENTKYQNILDIFDQILKDKNVQK